MAYLEEHLITNLATFARFNDKALTPLFSDKKLLTFLYNHRQEVFDTKVKLWYCDFYKRKSENNKYCHLFHTVDHKILPCKTKRMKQVKKKISHSHKSIGLNEFIVGKCCTTFYLMFLLLLSNSKNQYQRMIVSR